MVPHESPLEIRLRSISTELCGALERVLTEALEAEVQSAGSPVAQSAGSPLSDAPLATDRPKVTLASPMRPVQLTQRLGLNKSLASRVVRAIHEEDALQALRGIPTPQGLQLISRAAKSNGAADPSLARLAGATAAYSALLAEFSGGRTDLEATLAGWLPDLRVRAERDARRSVFRGMTTLSGTRASAIYNSLYLLPSAEDQTRVDSLLVTVRQDVRRLQPSAELNVMRVVSLEDGNWRKRRRTLDGEKIGDDPRKLLIPELCSHPIPELELDSKDPGAMVLRIASKALDVNEFATLGVGWRTTTHYARVASEGLAFGSIVIGASTPVEAMVLDLFVHKDLELAGLPFTSLNKDRAPYSTTRNAPPAEDSEQRTAAPKVIDLDAHPSGLASQDVRSCKAIAENVCREANLEANDFLKFRTRIEFPVMTEALTLWWPLPAAT